MAMTDPIADMLTRIRNAGKAKLKSVDVPGSKLKIEIAKVMQEQGYIKNFKIIEDDKQGVLRLYLKYDEKQIHAVYGLERVSKPSRRIYSKSQDIKPIGPAGKPPGWTHGKIIMVFLTPVSPAVHRFYFKNVPPFVPPFINLI